LLKEREWSSIKQRLSTISGIAKKPNADTVALQQAEAEFRHVTNQLTARLKLKMTGVRVSTANLNADDTKKILLECGIETGLVSRISMALKTIDDAHHTPASYSVNREKIRQYEGWTMTLLDKVEKAIPPKTTCA
jgi:hypothetical protein